LSARRPTILQIIPRLDTGGAELSTIEIAGAVAEAGGTALVATEGGRMADRIAEAGGEIVPFAAATKNPLTILANARRLERLIAERGVALVHARSRAPAWSALLAARRAGIPFVTTYHGAYAERGRLKRLYNSVMARADIVIANSAYTAGLVQSRYGTPASRIRIIHRGVDLARFDLAAIQPERVAALRTAWDVSPDAKIVLQAARLTSWKGQRVLVEAAGRLAGDGRLADVAIVLAGDAQGREGYTDTLRADILRLGLGGRVHLVGHVDDMPAAFAAAHVAVVASIEPEAFGRAAAEAEAMACPVIATDIGAPRETVLAEPAVTAQHATGWLVPPGDADALADRLARALALAPHERSSMGSRARRHVAENFTLARMRRATLDVYDGLLGTDLARCCEA
jgi:glycosyltransferase involved in cell wall biosynthesis